MNADGFRFICVYLCPSAVNILVQNARTFVIVLRMETAKYVNLAKGRARHFRRRLAMAGQAMRAAIVVWTDGSSGLR